MYVKELTKGQSFFAQDSTTLYVCENVRVQDGYAFVSYVIPSTGTRAGFPCRPFSTVTPA